MKSILLVNQYYWPQVAATAQLLTDLAEDVAAAGHDVTVLAGRTRYAAGDTKRLKRREHRRGVAIRRLWCTDFGRGSLCGRITDYLSFFLSVGVAIATGRRHDVVVCLSTPPLLALVGLVARARGSTLVYKVEDLYPEVAVALGVLRETSLLTRSLAELSTAVLSRADAVVALDGAMKRRLIDRGARRVEVIPNWADGTAIFPDPPAGEAFNARLALGGRFVALYSGNMGKAHRFDAVVDAVIQLETSQPEVYFLFVGSGPREAELREALDTLSNVRFLPYQSRDDLQGLFNAADLHLVTLRDEVAGLLVPSKYSSALAAGKPVLLVGGQGTDLYAEIDAEGVGWVCPHDAETVRSAIAEAAVDTEEAARRGSRGRSLFEAKYSRALAVDRWLELLG